MKIPLFDIDGTLFKTRNPIHQNAFEFAFKKVYGKNAKQTDVRPEGKTDKQIIVEVLKLHEVSDEEIKKKINTAMQVMAEYFSGHRNEVNPEALPGVKTLLQRLKEKNVPAGVLTGNVEDIGWTKIERAGLRDFFDFGAFGDKTEKRVELVEIARKNAETTSGKTFQIQDFVIIGDTPKDIKCAKDAGIESIIAATGIFSFDELAKFKPDLLVHTLEDQRVFDFLIS